jgi:hypothetical protein
MQKLGAPEHEHPVLKISGSLNETLAAWKLRPSRAA